MITNIVLAEDDQSTAFLVKRQLENYGFKVFTANNGYKALEFITSENIDLLITDVVMPEMDGVDLYLALKNNVNTEKLPIIIITDKEMFKESFSALGVDHFLPKSSNITLLINKIQEVDKLSPKPLNYRKILIGGNHYATVTQMKNILQKNGCLVSSADNSIELASKAFLMTPHVIFLDLLMTEKATASELINSFRALNLFKDTNIITYVHLSSSQVNPDMSALSFISDEATKCQNAGATKYIGRFSQLTFQDTINTLNILTPSNELVHQ